MSTFARNTPSNTGVRGSAATHRRPRPSPTLALPRPLPWESPLTRMWVGTKIICLAILTTLLVLLPKWPTVAAVGVCLLVAAVVGRVPISARPRLPSWIWAGFIGGMIGAAIGGGAIEDYEAEGVFVKPNPPQEVLRPVTFTATGHRSGR